MAVIKTAISRRDLTRQQYYDYILLKLPPDEVGDDNGVFVNWSDGSDSWEPKVSMIKPDDDGLVFYIGTKTIRAKPQDNIDGQPGYKVVYADGYESWSPKDVFEAAYQTTDAMSFGHAVEALKENQFVARAGWNGKGMWLGYEPFNQVRNMLPFIFMKTVTDEHVPWLASQTDILAEDWMIVSPT